MKICPYTNDSTTCGALSRDEHASTIAYCQKCSQIAFRCTSGHWNRAFARYCTQCRQELEKPAVWEMASANPHRTAIRQNSYSQKTLINDFSLWECGTPTIPDANNLPEPLAVDGHIVLPNSSDNSLNTYTIVKSEKNWTLKPEWNIKFDMSLTYSTTPIYHGLHLYYVMSGAIQKSSVLKGEVSPVEIMNVDIQEIESPPECAPLKCDVDGNPTMIVGLRQGVLLYNLVSGNGEYINHRFFDENSDPMSPVLCDNYVIFTSKQAGIFSLNLLDTEKRLYSPPKPAVFSAPVSVNGKVYFEAIDEKGLRSLVSFDPRTRKMSKAMDLDIEPKAGIQARVSLYRYPPVTDGKRLFLIDRHAQTLYVYDTEKDSNYTRELQYGDSRGRFVPHLSTVANNRIYSAHSSGLTVIRLTQNFSIKHDVLASGTPNIPRPVTRPIQFSNKLFVLCQEYLVCLNY